jgi:hypothetical protein
MRRIYLFILLGSLLTLLSTGCNSAGEENSTNTSGQITIPPSPPYTIEVAFPEGAPSLNNEAVLTCKVKAIYQLTNMKIEIKLPEFLELVNGELTWSGDVPAGDELTVINTDIVATDIGNGAIQIRHSRTPDIPNTSFSTVMYVSVFNESARWDKYPLWYEGHGPLTSVYISGDPLIHINMYMCLSHLPRLNETAELLCTIMPRKDCPDVKAEIVLPKGAVLTDGSLEWQGDLKADKPIHYSAKIKFNLIGDWRIDAGMWRWFDGEYSWNVTDSIYLNIGLIDSEYGGPPRVDFGDFTPPPISTVSPDENLPPPSAISP